MPLSRERLDAVVSGIRELDRLRRRQKALVRAALEEEEDEEEREVLLSSEENILMLRIQLSCLRRRDAGLMTQLQELDQQISDLRLDIDVSPDQAETDSRPSSGFYELSDGASGSLSNSSHSVYSECLFSATDTDGHFPSTDELASCMERDVLVGGLCTDSSSSGAVCRLLSALHPHHMDASSSALSTEFQSSYYIDRLAQNGTNIYHYPSPLSAMAIQSSTFLNTFCYGRHDRDETGAKCLKHETSLISESVSDLLPAKSTYCQAPLGYYSQKNMESYIYSLLQRRAQPIRSSRPRTTISTDPSKNIQRQTGLCGRQASGTGSCMSTLKESEMKPSCLTGGTAEGSKESKEKDTQTVFLDNINMIQNGFKFNGNGIQNMPVSIADPLNVFREPGSPPSNSTQKETSRLCCTTLQEQLLKSPCPVNVQSGSRKKGPKREGADRLLELTALGTSSQILKEGRVREGGNSRNSVCCPTKRSRVKNVKSNRKNVRTTNKIETTMETVLANENKEMLLDRRSDKYRYKSSSRELQLLENGGTKQKVSKKGASSSMNCISTSIPESQGQETKTTLTLSTLRTSVFMHHHHKNRHHKCSSHCQHPHRHRRSQVVVAKPQYKRKDYRRSHAVLEIPYDRTTKQARQHHKKEGMCNSATNMYTPFEGKHGSPYSKITGSDSEYSAECMSLFHSTIVDTSENESSYTTNCFGDSESSGEEGTTASDTEESLGGGAGDRKRGVRSGWGQLATVRVNFAGQETSTAQTKAFVKVKASYNLKKKILRFKTGSLKLMTTV
ncbi:dapper homolog 1 [Menidia menidia]